MINQPSSPSLAQSSVPPGWKSSFADLLALVLTFFVLLFAMRGLPGSPETASQSGVVALDAAGSLEGEEADRATKIGERARTGLDLSYLETLLSERIGEQAMLSTARVAQHGQLVELSLPLTSMFTVEDQPETVDEALMSALVGVLDSLENAHSAVLVLPAHEADTAYDRLKGMQMSAALLQATKAAGLRRSLPITLSTIDEERQNIWHSGTLIIRVAAEGSVR